MRTVDQVVSELKKADEAIVQATKQREVIYAELNEIYQAAMRGLNLEVASGPRQS